MLAASLSVTPCIVSLPFLRSVNVLMASSCPYVEACCWCTEEDSNNDVARIPKRCQREFRGSPQIITTCLHTSSWCWFTCHSCWGSQEAGSRCWCPIRCSVCDIIKIRRYFYSVKFLFSNHLLEKLFKKAYLKPFEDGSVLVLSKIIANFAEDWYDI